MQAPVDFLALARQSARQLAGRSVDISLAGDDDILHAEIRRLREAFPPAHFFPLLPELSRQALATLDHAPRQARSLALLADQLAAAETESHVLEQTGLALALVLNRLGEFQAARELSSRVAARAAGRGANELQARCLREAAWADTFIGDLDRAQERIGRARALYAAPLFLAQCDWVEARVIRYQGRFPEAISLLGQVRTIFQDAACPIDATRCERDIAQAQALIDGSEALLQSERAGQFFREAGCILDAALCDLVSAICLFDEDGYERAVELLTHARQSLIDQSACYYVALAEMFLGIAYRYLERFQDARLVLHHARDYFLSHGIRAEVAACDINLGSLYHVLNRYQEALALYEEAHSLCLQDGRQERTARIRINIGLVHIKQGRFSQALDSFHRALEIATANGFTLLASAAHHGLGTCYRELGEHASALLHLSHVKATCVENQQHHSLIQCNVDLAQIHLARGETKEALACLDEARTDAAEDNLDSFVAICDRLRAQAIAPTSDKATTLTLVENARLLFSKHSQAIDAALCDLTEGELRIEWGELAQAQRRFKSAHKSLAPAFPDQAWRADYGLGRCAAAAGHPKAALAHYVQAVRGIATTRSSLVTEQLSNDFFARRQSVFSEALGIAAGQGARQAALEVIEASKARTFLTLLEQRGWKVRAGQQSPYIAGLIARERDLSHQLETLRGQIAVQAPNDGGPVLRRNALTADPSDIEKSNALSLDYESVVSQLRLATSGLAGVSVPAPFAVGEFRRAANAAFGSDWTALDYYLDDDMLTVVVVAPDRLETSRVALSPFDRAVLEKCTSNESDLREMVYRGTLHGASVPSQGAELLHHLGSLLIPSTLKTTMLLIAPHGALHTLPFHALADRDGYLVERHTIVYTPSLQVLQALLQSKPSWTTLHPLVLGLSQFGDKGRPLPFARAEMDRIRQALGGSGQYWQEEAATREKILDFDLSGQLKDFDLIHFATHAVLDRASPHQSRILLHDSALTALDILDLSLDARLVTLSACQTALGQGGRGDEWLGLTRAFFFAGAQAFLATLWPVEDAAVAEFIGCFYQHWVEGGNAARALREAQLEMIRAGSKPYQWAPFVLIGRP